MMTIIGVDKYENVVSSKHEQHFFSHFWPIGTVNIAQIYFESWTFRYFDFYTLI